MRYKNKVEILHEVDQKIYGNEPFLSFSYPWMIVNLNAGPHGSHNFFEGRIRGMDKLRPTDRLVVQVKRVSLVPMKWYEALISDLRDWWSK